MSRNDRLKNAGRPRLFEPATSARDRLNSVSREVKLSILEDTNIEGENSYRYDPVGTGLKSTQEVPLDWSKFENHTFFNSAKAKVNIAFDRIINEYPFDGSNREIEEFEDSLTGYEKYILDTFPKNTGFLMFSGTLAGETPAGGFAAGLGTRVDVIDSAGSQFPDFSKDSSLNSVIDFNTDPFSVELWLRIPPGVNASQIICQKRLDSNHAITLLIPASTSTTSAKFGLMITSGTAQIQATGSFEKGKMSHICAVYDRGSTEKIFLYLSQSLVASSSTGYRFNSLDLDRAVFTIGSGSAVSIKRNTDISTLTPPLFSPTVTLSGSIDEFRVWHEVRSADIQKQYARKSVYPKSGSQNNLKLYFKFNEPYGEFDLERVALDSSGNSLHSIISNYTGSLRATGSMIPAVINPMSHENIERAPILFPSFEKVSTKNSQLLLTASNYDRVNPNLVTNLIPEHYLTEGKNFQGFSTQDGRIGDAITGKSIPGSAVLGPAQYITAFMLIYAKFFDEIKVFIDHYSNIIHPSYDDNETVASKFLPFVANYYGIELPSFFPDVEAAQYIDGEDIEDDYSKALKSLSYVQNEIWRRILININDIIRSKGTIHSIKSLIRAAGIEPDNLMSIREYGGPTKKSLTGLREKKSEVASSLDFSGSIASAAAGTLNKQGFSNSYPAIFSTFLSSSRVEVGYPEPVGTFVDKVLHYPHGISNNPSDGLLTSGSFTFEAIYQFTPNRNYSPNQSLARLQLTSSGRPTHIGGIAHTNLIVMSGTVNSITSSGSTLRLYSRAGTSGGASDGLLKLDLEGPNIFDGNRWNISFGRIRSDEKVETKSQKYLGKTVSTAGSSSYFLRCSRQSFGEIKEYFATASYFLENDDNNNVLQSVSPSGASWLARSGSRIVIGSQSMQKFTGIDSMLNDPNLDSREGASSGDFEKAMLSNFQGQVGQIRFWSKYLDDNSWKEHVTNFKSLGVQDPLVNFNFEKQATGSFQRLRMDASIDQQITASDIGGSIYLTDFSQNNTYMTGSGFEVSKVVIKPETFYYSHLSPKFDVAQTDNKVRIRSYQTADLLSRNLYANAAPVYNVLKSEQPDDDTRFTVEFSAVKALDEDIMKTFGTLEFFDNALGSPNLIFDDSYPDIEQMRKIYFNRLTGKPDYQVFFDMYKWFNTALGPLVEQLVPRKSKFLGINFVIESHVLERNRFRYLFDEIYLLSLQRDTSRGNLFLSQIVGNLKKF